MLRHIISSIVGSFSTDKKTVATSPPGHRWAPLFLQSPDILENELAMRSDIRKSRQSQKDVPQELIDLFIDHLHDDRKALKSCGLVCKAWLPASRHHLFRSVSLAFVGNSYVGQFIPFTKLLGHSSCTFATSIQELEIYASDDDGSGQGYWMHGWLDPLLPHLPKLVSVTSLSCTEVGNHHTADSWGSMIRVHQFTDQITHLELIYPLFSSFTEHMASICAFSSLVTLSYHNDSRGDSHLEDDPTFLQPPPKSLQVLDLSNPGYSTLQLNSSQLMFRWLLRSKAVLHTLKLGQIDHITTDKFAILSLYMQFLDSSLLFLEVGFRQSEAISLFLDNVDLSSNNGVQSFDLGYSSDCFPMLPHLLSGVSGDALTDIRFDGPLYRLGSEAEETWSAIDELLSGPRFSSLTTLGWQSSSNPSEKLPKCISRGIKIYKFIHYL